MRGVGRLQHRLARIGVGAVALARLQVDRRELPALQGIFQPLGEAIFLHRLVAAQPVLEQQDAVVDQLALEHRRVAQECGDLRIAGEPHHLLDAGAVVPAAVEQHDLAGGGQVRRVALEVPLGGFALGRLRQRRDPALARIEVAADGIDRAALAGGVAAFEHHHQSTPGVQQPARRVRQLDLHRFQQGLVLLALELAHRVALRAGFMLRATSSSAPCWRVLRLR